MLKAYLDYGAKEQADGIMCVAASLFTPVRYRQWCNRWTPMVRAWDAKAFHATDFYSGAREFWRVHPDGTEDKERMARYRRDSKRIPAMIADKVHHQFIVAFRANEFKAVAPANWRDRFGSLHAVTVQLTLQAIGHWADREKFHGYIAYFLESGDEAQNEIGVHLTRYQSDPKLKALARLASYTWADKGKVRGLEASDFLAWQWNKFYAESLATHIREPRQDLRALVQMLHTGKKRLNTTFFTGKGLEDMLVELGCVRNLKVVSRSSGQV